MPVPEPMTFALTSFFRRLAVSLAAVLLAAAGTLVAEESERVRDLRYGVALYEFFQQSYFDALTELMVGEELNDMPNHADEARLLRGGISLSYGLDREAETIFRRDLDARLEGRARARAWFYLGKMAWRRGDFERARAALQRAVGELPRRLSQEGRYMLASLELEAGNADAAASIAADMPDDSSWLPYYWFNRAVRLSAAGQWDQARQAFTAFGELPLESDEALALADRAWTAAGFAALGNGEYAPAMEFFQRVRLESPLVERALLGYGWAAARQADYRGALAPWQRLSERPPVSASVQESLLAVPYALEKLEATGAALERYERAQSTYLQALDEIRQARLRYREAPLETLFAFSGAGSDDWFSGGVTEPARQDPWLAEVVAGAPFQLAMRDLRDLYTVREQLEENRLRLNLLLESVYAQQQRWTQVLDRSRPDEKEAALDALQQRYTDFETRLQEATAAGTGLALMSVEERELWEIAEAASRRLARLEAAGEEVEVQRRKLAAMRGLLVWRASEQFPARRWQLEKERSELELQLLRARQALNRTTDIVASGDVIDFEARIAAMQHRTDTLLQRTSTQIAAAENGLRGRAIAVFDLQEERLRRYLGQARLAVARIYDTASTATVDPDTETDTETDTEEMEASP